MADEASARAAFLEQANRNNWQVYLSSLGVGGGPGWDNCILTASDERQADMYRRQLGWRREAGLLPRGTTFTVVADPGGRRIGSGGATLRVLAHAAENGAAAMSQRTLIIHSGGDSKRLPHCSATGKLFARVPRVLPDDRASTIFDEFLISLSGLAESVPPGVLIASGDVLIIFDHLQLSLVRPGVLGVSAAAPVETGTQHGVYVTEDATRRVRAYLHKPSCEQLAEWGGVDAEGTVQIDTGFVWLDAYAERRFADLAHQPEVWSLCEPQGERGSANPLNLYGDLLMPLPESTTFERYLQDSSDGPATEPIQRARRVIWEHLRGTPFAVESLRPAEFIHFGTSREYWGLVTASPELARVCGWESEVASVAPPLADGQVAPKLISAVVEQVAGDAGAVLVVDCHLGGRLRCAGAALLSGVRSVAPLELPADVVLHQLPVHGGFVTRLFGLDDDPKLAWNSPAGGFIGRAWGDWLAAIGVAPEAVWPDVGASERSLWNARLYPVTESRDESLTLSLPLCSPELANAEWRERWRDSLRLSLAESFALADGARLLTDVAEVEDVAAAKRFLASIVAEVPCAEAKSMLGTTNDALSRRAQLVARWLADVPDLLKLRGYRALADVTGSYVWEDRSFRTLAHMVADGTVMRAGVSASLPFVAGATLGEFRVAAAARLDFGGGWTDTPPHSIERGGTVTNAAIVLNGGYPITVEGAWLDEPRLVLDSRDIDSAYEPELVSDVLAYANPSDPFALLKAALVLRGVVPSGTDPKLPIAGLLREWGRGLRLSTRTDIPRGSGLGTSSIMAGAVLACIGQLLGQEHEDAALFDDVLCLEQMLTTGGGWQDQVGGLTGGVKLASSAPGLPQKIDVHPLRLSPAVEGQLAERLLLVYTGQQRLAKNLLRAVMGRWMARDREMVHLLAEIARLALDMRDALESGDVSGFGRLLAEHWLINKRMDPGCTNPFIDRLFETMGPYVDGGKLAGAGGGGFAMVIARDADAVARLEKALAERYPGTPVRTWPCAIAPEGWVGTRP